jgi:hypothetical protein
MNASVDSRWWMSGRSHAKAQSREAAEEKKKQNGRSQAVDLEELKSILRFLALIFFCAFAAWREI